jgi:hypothetical protein
VLVSTPTLQIVQPGPIRPTSNPKPSFMNKFSSLRILKMFRVYLFHANALKIPSSSEQIRNMAELGTLRMFQNEHFLSDISSLTNSRKLPNGSALNSLNPFMKMEYYILEAG